LKDNKQSTSWQGPVRDPKRTPSRINFGFKNIFPNFVSPLSTICSYTRINIPVFIILYI
jgi:hypothetical protein